MLLIEFLQKVLGEPWLPFFLGITNLGGEEAYMVCLSLYFWLVSPRQGRLLGLILVLSFMSNVLLKSAIATPRPYVVNPGVKTVAALATEGSFSFPSGHAQGAMTFWGAIALMQQKKWFWLVAISLILLVSLSRIYLGVHYPIDVVGGMLIGIVWVMIGAWLGRVERLPRYRLWQKTCLWMGGALMAIAMPLLAPLIGVFCGFFPVDIRHHQPPQRLRPKLVLGLMGIVLLGILFVTLKTISLWLPASAILHYGRYLLVTLGITEGIPWLWQRIETVR